jgi:thiol-disulfide isomerase/thioredoxin
MHTRSLLVSLALLAGGIALPASFTPQAIAQSGQDKAVTLKVGDKAPAIAVKDWLKGSKFEKFEPGKVYVVEFWATWCPPCRESIPHLTEIQKKYKDDGLVVLGVTSGERPSQYAKKLEIAKKFVNDQGAKMDYTVGIDDNDRTMGQHWTRAAGIGVIPSAFVIDHTGKIAFIGTGYPMAGFDEAVKKAVDAAKAAKGSKGAMINDRPAIVPVRFEQPADGEKPQKLEKQPDATPSLQLGDKAPELYLSKTVKGDPIAGFEKGKIYVVEFWATWCGPCRESIPHLTELQKKYKDVRFLGVSIWEDKPSDVEPFVKEMGDKMAYTVAMDDTGAAVAPESQKEASRSGKMAMKWMKASGQSGIPTAFIINGDGRIAWIGHPMGDLDSTLKSVIDGTWDLDRKVADARAKRPITSLRQIQKQFAEANEAGEWDKALAAIDKLIEAKPDSNEMRVLKYQLLLVRMRDYDKAYAYANTLIDGPAKDDSESLNAIAWFIVDPEGDVAKKDLKLAKRASERAAEITESKAPDVLDTLAKVYFDSGDLNKAIEIQGKAVKQVKSDDKYAQFEEEITKRLEEYKDAAKKKGGGA